MHAPIKTRPMAENRIREHRKSRKWTQETLSEMTGIDPASIGLLERGMRKLTTDHMRTFAAAFGVRPVDILPADLLNEDSEEFTHAPRNTPAMPYKHAVEQDLAGKNSVDVVHYLLQDDPNRSAWVLGNGDIAGQGYCKGDIVIVDSGITAQPGDTVCIQQFIQGTAETLFRIYQAPFLLAAPLSQTLTKPIYHDPNHVKIMGVVTDSLRQNRK